MDENKIISLENLNQYSDETSDKIKSYVDTKTSVIQDGTKTVGGVSAEDYNNFKSAYEDKHTHSNKSVLDEISEKTLNGGAELSGSTGYTVTDSVEYPIVGLKVFGKSTQDGTPTPENPVDIVSVENPTVTVCGKNLLNSSKLAVTSGIGAKTINSDGVISCIDKTSDGRVWAYNNSDLFVNLDKGIYTVSLITTKSSTNSQMTIYNSDNINIVSGKYFSEIGTQTMKLTINEQKTIGIMLKLYEAEIKIQIELGTTATDYDPYTSHTLTLPDTLNAIPVSSGGNVVIDGQEYIADYVDFERGVKVQRVERETLSGGFIKGSAEDGSILFQYGIGNILSNTDYYKVSKVICNKYKSCYYGMIHSSNVEKLDKAISDWYKKIVIRDTDYASVDDFNTYLATNPIEILYLLATPIETPLSETELQAYRQLQTYNGTTNISNDKGAGLSVKYCTSKMLAEYALPLIKDLEAENAKKDEEISALKTDILTNEKMHNRIYEGINLAEKFASEIAAAPYNGEVWAWIKARITAENFTGIRVGDYIPFTTTNGVTLNAQVAGINTYKNYGDTTVGSHIDFICKELWGTVHPVNKVNYNNGTESQPYPWLASDLYLYLNSLSGSVPNSAIVNPETVDVDYTADGVYYYLPEALKNVIIEKQFLLPKRYSASGLLTDDNQWGWANIGKLWLPDECEVYGTPIWGGKGFSAGGSGLQYPLFAGNMNRLKFRNGSRSDWWLLSPYSGGSSHWCLVSGSGDCYYYNASHGYIAAPVCFRV